MAQLLSIVPIWTVMQYQAIVNRAINPKNLAVIAVGSRQVGSDHNVIPATSLLKVKLRWCSEQDRQLMINGVEHINEGIAHAYNMLKDKYPEMKMKSCSTPLDNDTELTHTVQNSLVGLVNEKNILKEDKVPFLMGSEDSHHLVIHNDVKKYGYPIVVGRAQPNF